MACGIYVKKIFENINRVTYEANANDYGGLHYFISVNKGEDRIFIYKDKNLTEMLGLIDLAKLDEVIKIPGVPNQALWFSVIRLIKNMKQNIFPNSLDYVTWD